MKKIIALTLALVLCLGLGITAPAAEITQETEGASGSTEVKYEVSNGGSSDDSWVVNIPAVVAVDLTEGEGSITISAANVKALSGHTLKVTVNSQNSFTLKNGESEIAYTVTQNDAAVANGAAVLSIEGQGFLTGASGSATLAVSVTDAAINAATAEGKHSDTLTFACSCASSVRLITFHVYHSKNSSASDDNAYIAEEGMTWAEWLVSDYNTDSFAGNEEFGVWTDGIYEGYWLANYNDVIQAKDYTFSGFPEVG